MITFGIIILLIIVAYLLLKLTDTQVAASFVKSTIDNNDYIVQDKPDKYIAANNLAIIKKNIYAVNEYMMKNINDTSFLEYKNYIERLNSRIYSTKISEGLGQRGYTSYTINKGDEIVFCIRSERTGTLLPINLVMYVVLHEISHIACPEQGHTELFNKIFKFIAKNGINAGVYKKIDFHDNPSEYCGMTINESII